MKGRYILTTVAVLAVGALAFGTIPMWKGTDSVKQEETKTSVVEDPVNPETKSEEEPTENNEQRTPVTPLPTTAPVEGISHADSYESLYNMLKEWKENSSNNVQPRVMMIEETADAAGDTASASGVDMGASDNMVVSKSDEPLDPEFGVDPSEENGDYSTTNTQEELVDEADIVKTDGTCIYALDSKGNLRIIDVASMKLMDEIKGEVSSDYKELYVDGDCLQLIRQQEDYVTYKGSLNLPSTETNAETDTEDDTEDDTENSSDAADSTTDSVRTSYSMQVTTVTVETYDISDKENPKKTGTYQQDGSYLSSRRNGGRLYLFTSYTPDAGDDADQLQYYVPRSGEEYISCDHIYLPMPDEDFSYNGKVFLVAGAVSPDQPDQATDVMAVVSSANTFYVSENNIYSVTEIWNDTETRTEIVRIGYDSGEFADGATGSVKGELNNNFSMDEYDGNLRVVTTVEGWDKDYSNYSRDNSLYVLDSTLKTIGKIENLAEDEEIKSARFMGKTGYFVTYRNTDPLFAVDLSDPENPKVIGELKITGFSEYLHFYGEDQLLGIGWETDPDTGNVSGMKCSMFDLSDPTDIKETDRFILKDVSFCDALSNYRAILAAPKKNLFGFAYGIYGNTNDVYDSSEDFYYGLFSYSEEEGFSPEVYLNMNNNELFEGDMSYQDYRRVRGAYIGDVFYLVTEKGIASYNMQEDYALTGTLKWEQ